MTDMKDDMLTISESNSRVFEITLFGTVDASDIGRMKRDLTPKPEADGKMGLILPLKIRAFDASEEDVAREWARAA